MGSDAGADSFLNDSWTWYAHDPADDKWTLDSYDALCTVSTAKEFVQAHRAFSGLLTRGMHFLMRSHVKPIWECKENENGGCLSIKIMKNDVANAWFDLGALLLGETLVKSGGAFNPEMVTGHQHEPQEVILHFPHLGIHPSAAEHRGLYIPYPELFGRGLQAAQRT